jgi:hypothetical protein
MATAWLRHATTGAVISVEIPPTGLSHAYARSGWTETSAPKKKPTVAIKKQPAEPVNPSPAEEPVDPPKE